MSSSSQAVKNWRENTKKRMVAAMGGKCCICDYNRCNDGLEFHHKDPAQKDFTLGNIKANPKSWSAIVRELKKCALVCCRCHREIHAGITVLPDNVPCFDPLWEDYKLLEKAGMTTNCPTCGSPKRPESKHCSLRCAGVHRQRFDWDDYDLDNMLMSMSRKQIADHIGSTLAGLEKHLRSRRRCSICGNMLNQDQETFCSVTCTSKSRRKVEWEKYDLLEMVKTMSKKQIGRLLGVSDSAIHKRLRTLKIMLPPLGSNQPHFRVTTERIHPDC